METGNVQYAGTETDPYSSTHDGTGRDMLEAQHIQQWSLDHDGICE